MGAFNQLTALEGDLTVLAKKLNYPASSICVLSGDIDALQRDYPNIYKNLLSCSHNKDSRSYILYGQDLVASWLYEDYLMHELKMAGLNIVGAGADKNREILPNVKVSTDSDCQVSYKGKERGLELMNDHKGFWKKTHTCHLRDNKYQKIVKSHSIFLGVSTLDNTYLLFDDITTVPSEYIPFHRFWHKPAQELKLKADDLKAIDYKVIAQRIKGMLIE